MDAKAEKMALLRYGLIAPPVSKTLRRGELMQRAREIAARHYEIPGCHGSRFPSIACCTGPGVTARWFRSFGSPALAGSWNLSRFTPQLAELIERLKRENPYRTGTTLPRELALGSSSDSCSLAPATLYRFLKQLRLSAGQLHAAPARSQEVSSRV